MAQWGSSRYDGHTFSPISEFDVCRSLRDSEGIEEFHAIRADAEDKGYTESHAQQRAHGNVGGNFAG